MKISASIAVAMTTIALTTEMASAQVPYFGNYYAFGDSLSDNGRVLRETGFDPTIGVGVGVFGAPGIYQAGHWSNLPNYTEILPGLIGATHSPDRGFAIGGSTAYHLPPNAGLSPTFAWGLPDQIDQFSARFGRFASNDLVNVWVGYNDMRNIGAGATPAQVSAGATTIVGNTVGQLQRLVDLGARQFVVFNQETFRPDGLGPGAVAVNSKLLPALTSLKASTGVNIHYFDVDALATRLRANPTAYGFAANAGTVACSQVPACAANGYSTGQENQYISPEGIHFTGKVNLIIANFLANQLNAPFTMPVQANMAQSAGAAFVGSLQGRIDAYRYSDPVASPMNANAMYTKAPPKKPFEEVGPWSIYAMGTFAQANQKEQVGQPGVDNSFGAGTVGLDYRWDRNLTLGGAFSYADSSTTLGLQNTRTDLKSYQFAGYAVANYRNWFADLVTSFGVNNYNVSRDTAGLGSIGNSLTASPNGNNFVVASRVGYLFDTATMRVGPLVGLTYNKMWINSYTENGDPILTQSVGKQNLDGWTASAGLQFRLPTTNFPRGFNPFLNVTAEQSFGGNSRVITTAQTYALALPIATQIGNGGSQTYGKVAGGTSIDLGGRFSANVNAETTFARQNGNIFSVTAGLSARL